MTRISQGKLYRHDNGDIMLGLFSGSLCSVGDQLGMTYTLTTETVNFATPLSELETLVFWANFGAKKAAELQEKYGREVEHNASKASSWTELAFVNLDRGFRIKKKAPVFEAFTVSEGWKVEAKGDAVTVGCKTFGLEDLISSLHILCSEESYHADFEDGSRASVIRKGISYRGCIISWKSADRILAALKKYREERS